MDPSPKIIPALTKRQKERGGYLTPQDKADIAYQLGVPPYRVESLVTFFPHFRETPPAGVQVHICRDMTCHLRGSLKNIDDVSKWCEQNHGDKVEVCGVSCLGRCDRAPAAMVNERLYVLRSAEELQQVIDGFVDDSPPPANSDMEVVEPKLGDWKMDIYNGEGRYEAVREYLKNPNPLHVFGIESEEKRDGTVVEVDGIEGALTTAYLLGMGGAGGRAYKKWREVYKAVGTEKYVVCNADESEPGTFKDRDILVAAPHLTIEGMILAGLCIGARRGWVYTRHEYHEQVHAVEAEIERARRLGALGRDIFGSGESFEIEVFVSPGGYICGEQTALIEAMEDKRAEPRNRPPELITNGFRNQPTLLSNVETFAWVPAIMMGTSRTGDDKAGKWFASQGRKKGPWVADQGAKMRGLRLFSISGDVARPGVYEVPTGIPLGELIDEYCQGMADGKKLIAAALSGPSGGLLPARIPVVALSSRFVKDHVPDGVTELELREIPLDINVARALGIMIGGGIVIYGSGADLIQEALACSRFFRNETCGKCVPCRVGATKITGMGELLAAGKISRGQLPVLDETAAQLSDVMKTTSICGLGQVASNPIRSLLKYFPDLVNRVIADGESR